MVVALFLGRKEVICKAIEEVFSRIYRVSGQALGVAKAKPFTSQLVQRLWVGAPMLSMSGCWQEVIRRRWGLVA